MAVWKPVIGYEDCYQVSDEGEVARVSTYGGAEKWKVCRTVEGRDGYIRAHLSREGRARKCLVHRLMCEAFIGPIPPGMQVNHKNGARSDNRLTNLEVCTCQQNLQHSFRVLGRKAANNPSPGSKNGGAKLGEADIPEIRRLHGTGRTNVEIAEMFGVSGVMIGHIVKGRAWTHVP